MTTYFGSIAASTLNTLASYIVPTAQSKHCSNTMPSEILSEDHHLLFDSDGNRYDLAGLRERAYQTAVGYYHNLDDFEILSQRNREFVFYANALGKVDTKYDYGLSHLTDATHKDFSKKQWIELSAARCISIIGEYPTRATALQHLSEHVDPLRSEHLKRIDAYAEDAVDREKKTEEAGTEVDV